MQCRICYVEEGEVIYPCKCTAPVHEACLSKWLHISGRDSCEVCLHPFEVYEEVVDVYNEDVDILTAIFCVGLVLLFGCAQFGLLVLFTVFTNYILVISNVCQMIFYCICAILGADDMSCLLVMKISSMMSFVLHDFVFHTRSVGFYVEMVSCLCFLVPFFCFLRHRYRVRSYIQ